MSEQMGSDALERTREMPVVKAMQGKAPLSTNVLHVPVVMPMNLYIRSGDWEHDDAIVASVYIMQDLAQFLIELMPERTEFHAMRLQWLNVKKCADEWLETDDAKHTRFVTVVIPLPMELIREEWGHWLSVEVGRYAGRCIQAMIEKVGIGLGFEPTTISDSLFAEWDEQVNNALLD